MSMSPDAVFRFGNTTVAVLALDLIEAPTPAIVVSANNWLQPEPGSVADTALTRAGGLFATDLRAAVAAAPEEGVPPGAVVPIRGYDLAEGDARQAVIMAVTTIYPKRGSFEGRVPSSPQTVYAAVRNALGMASQMEAKAVSISLFGVRAGYGSEPPPVMASAFARALADHLAPGIDLDGVLVCERDDQRRALACQVLAAIARPAPDAEARADEGVTDQGEDTDQAETGAGTIVWLSRKVVEDSEEIYGWPVPEWIPAIAVAKGLGLPATALQAITLLAATSPAPVPGASPPDGVIWNPSSSARFLQFGCGWLTDAVQEARTTGDASRALGLLHLLVQVARQWHEIEPLGVQPLIQLATAQFDSSQLIRLVDPIHGITAAYRGLPFARAGASIEPDNPNACLLLGRYAVLFNNVEAARMSLRRVVELAPDSPQATEAEELLEVLAAADSPSE